MFIKCKGLSQSSLDSGGSFALALFGKRVPLRIVVAVFCGGIPQVLPLD